MSLFTYSTSHFSDNSSFGLWYEFNLQLLWLLETLDFSRYLVECTGYNILFDCNLYKTHRFYYYDYYYFWWRSWFITVFFRPFRNVVSDYFRHGCFIRYFLIICPRRLYWRYRFCWMIDCIYYFYLLFSRHKDWNIRI